MNKIFLWISAKRWDIKVQHFLDTNTKKSLDNRIDECEKLIEEYRNMLYAQKRFVNNHVDLLMLLDKLKSERGGEKRQCFLLSPRMRRKMNSYWDAKRRIIEEEKRLKCYINDKKVQRNETEADNKNEDFVPVIDTSVFSCGCGSNCDCDCCD